MRRSGRASWKGRWLKWVLKRKFQIGHMRMWRRDLASQAKEPEQRQVERDWGKGQRPKSRAGVGSGEVREARVPG